MSYPPYYIIPDIEALPNTEGKERERICRRISALVGDPATARNIIGDKTAVHSPQTHSRNAKPAQTPDEENAVIPLPPLDYDLSEIESSPIIIEEEPFIKEELKEPETKNDEQKISESLAHTMIKNGNYSQALEILTELSLNNPKKSIYFADQIRFLKKLILNQSAGNI